MSTFRVTGKTLAVLAASAALTIPAAGVAMASTTITPAGTTVTATSNDLRLVTPANITLRCTNVNGTGTTPASGSNSNPGTGGINIPISTVTLSSCTLQGLPATVTTTGGWNLNVDHDGASPMGRINIPAGGATVTSGACVINVGASTAGPLPYVSGKVTAANTGTINFTSNGLGSHCPSAGAGTATMTGTLSFNTPSGPPVVTP